MTTTANKPTDPERFVVFAEIEDGTRHRYCVPCPRPEAERVAEQLRASGRKNVQVVAAATAPVPTD